jgi:hypothetical protein
MKHFFLVILLLCSVALTSQTLTQVFNEPAPGDIEVSLALDTSAFTSGLPVNTGSNSVWNFTAMVGVPPNFDINYLIPSAVSGSSAFPGATVVQVDNPMSIFMKSTTSPTTQTEIVGLLSNTFSATFTNSAIAAVYPISFGTTKTDALSGTFTYSTFQGTCSGNITTIADGTGTLNLPDGISYKNVIRVKSTQSLTANQGLFPVGTMKQTIINYYDASEKFPILSVNYQKLTPALGNAISFGYVRANAKSFLVGINEHGFASEAAVFYPNPTNGTLFLKLPEGVANSSLRIINYLGEEVINLQLTGSKNTIDLRDHPAGIYIAEITSGSIRSTQLISLLDH